MAGDLTTDPQLLVRRGQITGLTDSEKRALAEGADLSQVVNARRGASGLRSMTTAEGVTRRGIAGARLITGDPHALIAPRGGDTVQREAFQRTQRLRDGRVVTQSVRISQARQARLTPEGIYRIASDREEAVALLRQHGYLL